MPRTVNHAELVRRILVRRAVTARALLVAVSGIDGSGKGYVARRLVHALEREGVRPALLGVDPWLDLPDRRFGRQRPGEHFYLHALRLEEMFARLVLPLRDTGAVSLEYDAVDETATAYRRDRVELRDVDVIVLEGIFLFKRAFRPHHDLAVWLDCSFETALARAVARGQEGLPPEETVRAYETIYFPAQRIHFERDEPRASADLVLPNDRRE